MRRTNPYNYNLAVVPEMFFGRNEDVETIARSLTIFPGDSFAIVGGRRMGKTSMLEALLRRLNTSVDDLLLLLVFLDLTGEGINSVSAFYHNIGERVEAMLADLLPTSPDDNHFQDLSQPPAPAFARRLDHWARSIKDKSGKRLRIIVLLDECEQIVEQPWTSELYSTLRYLLMGQTTRSLFKIVMAGSHRFLIQVREDGSPLRNVLQYYRLSNLDESAAQDLVNQPTNSVLPNDIVGKVILQSGCHPFLTQYLMYHLWERGLENVTLDEIDEIVSAFYHERNDFRDWLTGFGLSGKRVYKVLIQFDGPISDEVMRASLRPVPDDLPQIIDALCYHGLVRQVGNDYQITGEMFKKWFTKNCIPTNPRMHTREALESSVVRIQTKDGVVKGSGFLITEKGLIVTCTHVIESLGTKAGESVYLAFQPGNTVIEAKVVLSDNHIDVTFLYLVSPLPVNVYPAILGKSSDREGHDIIAFGYPSIGNKNGLWGDGRITGLIDEAGRELLQLDSSQITVGFSGGPVAIPSTGQVIGMVTEIGTADKYGKMRNVVFAIPSEKICDLCPEPLALV